MVDSSVKSKRDYWFGNPDELSPDTIKKSPPDIYFKEDSVDFTQSKLSFMHIFDYLPDDHECFEYTKIFKKLDYTPLMSDYSPLGQRAYHPGRITEILIYAYCDGVYSSRQIERKCHTDLGYMYISRMNCPNFRVLSDFRKDNNDYFQTLFKESVAIAEENGLMDFKNVSQDGSKFKADTSKHKAMSYGRMKDKIAELEKFIENIMTEIEKIESKEALEIREENINPGEQIPDKSQISFADTDARIMGKKGDFDYRYNGQISVDSKNQIIIAQHLTQNANDKQEVMPALTQILDDYGKMPDSMSFDNGYFSGHNLEALKKFGVNAFVAVGREEKQDVDNKEGEGKLFGKSVFTYVEAEDVFICPNEKIMKLKSKSKDGKRIYSGIKEECLNCKYRISCCKSKRGQPRTVSTDDYEPLRNEMRDKMQQLSSKEIYARRKTIVEPVFGQIKNKGFRDIHLRGFEKAKGEFALICSCHNLKKSVRYLRSINFVSSFSNNLALCSFLAEQSVSAIKISINRALGKVRRCRIFCTEILDHISVSKFVCCVKFAEKNSCFRTAS
ncbi:IS1182 family transposase [Methanoplanus limicola]|uniref:Transposase, IS4 family n=1 Tax=Methanoplanus limicola DSM 2279 TaxID=937775 RepID=H1Z4E9_9EURY|nr:IS1182 family transposase [Methanoplanus limicola]EHQ36697.1 transposase, IS4 family [Methanoplanus limicola DSM 2279]